MEPPPSCSSRTLDSPPPPLAKFGIVKEIETGVDGMDGALAFSRLHGLFLIPQNGKRVFRFSPDGVKLKSYDSGALSATSCSVSGLETILPESSYFRHSQATKCIDDTAALLAVMCEESSLVRYCTVCLRSGEVFVSPRPLSFNVAPYVHKLRGGGHAIGLNGLGMHDSNFYAVMENSPMSLFATSGNGSASALVQFHHLVSSPLCGTLAHEVRSLRGVAVQGSTAFVLAQTRDTSPIISVSIWAAVATGHLSIPTLGLGWDIAVGDRSARYRIYVASANKMFIMERADLSEWCASGQPAPKFAKGFNGSTSWCSQTVTREKPRSRSFYWIIGALLLVALLLIFSSRRCRAASRRLRRRFHGTGNRPDRSTYQLVRTENR